MLHCIPLWPSMAWLCLCLLVISFHSNQSKLMAALQDRVPLKVLGTGEFVQALTLHACSGWRVRFFFSFWIKVEWLMSWCTSYSMLNPLCWSAVNAKTWSGKIATGIALLKNSKGRGHATVWSSSLKLISQIDWQNFKVWHVLPQSLNKKYSLKST